MKEFSAQTGGRYTYADDLENIQELALAFAALFDDCDNFIVSGCEVSGSAVSAGYVFINGKLRYFSGATGITSWPRYIYELNTTESVPYESGGSKTGRNIYGCAIGKTVPTALDILTNKVPQSIAITSTGGRRMKDAFIGKYALLLNPESGSQTVNSIVKLMKSLEVNSDLIADKNVTIDNGTLKTTLSYNGSTFSMESTSNNHSYRLAITDGIGFQFYADNTLIATIKNSSVVFNKPITYSEGTFGGLVLTGNGFYQGTANTTADMRINMEGYNGGISQFRNTRIGNGKGHELFSVLGADNSVNMFGVTKIQSSPEDGCGLVIKGSVLKENASLCAGIAWHDSAGFVMARLGFTSRSGQTFYLSSHYDIQIAGSKTVNIGPAIMENGVLLSEKYVSKSTMTTELGKKANTSDVYTKQQADVKFATKDGGLSQFVTSTINAATCRSHIGAIGSSDLASYAKLDQFLSDMVGSDENKKKKVRDNIGAASAGDYEPKHSDTGWINVKDNKLFARQIGKMVSIQGTVKTVHSGTLFTLPASIQGPSKAVKLTIGFSNNRTWTCRIAGGTKTCTVVYCDSSCGRDTEFSLTYFI